MKITISYQPQQLTPPHAYAAVLILEPNNDALQAQLSIEYLGRDSISKQEIQAEGFTSNDDYKWNGQLDTAWQSEVECLVSLKRSNEANNDIYLHVHIDEANQGFPVDVEQADLIFQELLQSILEMNGIELPLAIQVYIDNKEYEFTWEFSKRSVLKNGAHFKNWETGRELMEHIFSMNYETISPAKKPKTNSVNFDGQWYPLNKKTKKYISKLVLD